MDTTSDHAAVSKFKDHQRSQSTEDQGAVDDPGEGASDRIEAAFDRLRDSLDTIGDTAQETTNQVSQHISDTVTDAADSVQNKTNDALANL